MAAALALVLPCFSQAAVARPAAIAPGDDLASDHYDSGHDETDALPYVQCVPFARQASGIQLFGDAHTWWDQADGLYARGHVPRAGAVMSFRPYHAMTLGHVAMVSKVIDSRTVLLRHANWSPIGGRRGQAEMDVRAVDVSPDNDWSEVRVWYAPIGDLGTTRWPVNGFIYKHPLRDSEPPLLSAQTVLASADAPRMTRLSAKRVPASAIDGDFLDGIRAEAGAVAPQSGKAPARARPTRTYLFASATAPSAPATIAPALRDDPIGRIIAAQMGRTRD